MAGGVYSSFNVDYYLYTGQSYWTISPSNFYSSIAHGAHVFYVDPSGYLYGNNDVYNPRGVRPVINLRADVTISSGNGTQSTPFVIATT